MGWPIDDITRNHLNEDGDDPALGREEIRLAIGKLIQVIQGRSTSDGICELDAETRVPVSRLPTVPISRGGTGATTATNARTQLQLGTAATKNAGTASGVATLDANAELITLPAGASVAPNTHLLQSNGAWVPSPAPSAGSISQSLMKTADGAISIFLSAASHYVLPGGQFGFYPRIANAAAFPGNASVQFAFQHYSLASAAYIHVAPATGGSVEMTIHQRYVQASPPYDMGDGDVAVFVFCLVRKSDRKVLSVWFSDDPPWANNGPTDIRADEYDGQGRGCKWVLDLPFTREEIRAARTDPVLRARIREAARAHKRKLVPVTQELKQADMALIPHPFGEVPQGHVVVLIDPVGDLAMDLRDLAEAGEDVGELLGKDYVRVRNSPLSRVAPPGVLVRQVAWRDNG